MGDATEFLSPAELGKRLGVSRRTLFRLVSAGRLPEPVRLTKRTIRWEWAVVQQWLSAKDNRRKREGGGNDK